MLARQAVTHCPKLARPASSIALKYANAAYLAALAQSPQQLIKVQQDLTAIGSTLASSADLSAFVKDPTISARGRTTGLEALYKAVEGTPKKTTLSPVTKNLLGVLSDNGRLVETPHVIEGFTELVSKYKGELEVVVTSATPLPKDIMTRLEATLKVSQAGQKAKTLKVTNKVNPSVLGGLVVDFGDKTVDLSVASRVQKLNALLQESV